MKKDKPLTLSIPNPCSQDWNQMPTNGGGRYCNQCTKVIHDFSQMPDAELLQYFKTYPETSCGRFHKNQLNRAVQYPKKRWFLPNYYRKIAAAILAALSFRTATAQGVIKSKASVVMQPSVSVKKSPVPESIVISGKVTKGITEPVANAKVSVDTLITVQTDAEGKFSVTLNGDMIAPHNLYFSFEGLERTVRTFHPLMGSTNYDVQLLSKEDYYYYTMGVPIRTLDFPSIRFPDNQQTLSKDAKAILNSIAEKLKDNPGVMIQLLAFGKSTNDTKNAKRKLKLIRNFLINDLNITQERISSKIEKEGSNDTIDIVQYYGE